MKIGYQGDIGSNAEAAAHQMAKDAGLADAEFVPLFGSQNVIEAMWREQVDRGVVAYKNSQAGWVSETYEAFKGIHLVPIARTVLHIHHCMFKLSADVPDSQITVVASHAQALKQTAQNRAKLYPDLVEVPLIDTAIGARWLSEGKLDSNFAVLCRYETGIKYGLHLMHENLEDSPDNFTYFVMV